MKDSFLGIGFYFLMRFFRRSFFPGSVPERFRRFVPGMRANYGVVSSTGVANLYDGRLSPTLENWVQCARIMEIGTGETNSSCYELVARGAEHCIALEPYVLLDSKNDGILLSQCASTHSVPESAISQRVKRCSRYDEVAAESVDFILSNSVLEHVSDLSLLASDLDRILRPGGHMLHVVDYRDHFFSFPYHHLLWSDFVWNRYLNPGDLPRWRICDHIACFSERGMEVKVLRSSALQTAFERIRPRVHPVFHRYSEEDLSAAFGTLYITKKGGSKQNSEVAAVGDL